MSSGFTTSALLTLMLAAFAVAALVAALLLLRRPSAAGRLEADLDHVARAVNAALSDLGRLSQSVRAVGEAQADLRAQVASLRDKVQETGGRLTAKTLEVQNVLQREIAEAQKLVGELRSELEARRRRDEEVERAVRHLEAVLAGAPSKGAAGENILAEAFASFPPEMVERNFRVRGKVVEYALVMLGAGGRRMPIDSKWPASDALERLASETDPSARQKVVSEIRAEIRRKVREVAQYIDPLVTTDKAIAAIPDAAYPLCGELAFEAYRQGVIVMPYSMTVPYVLNLYNLHLKHARSVDLESLDQALGDIERNVGALEKTLDRVQRGKTMVENAYSDLRHIASQMRLALDYVRALPAAGEPRSLAAATEPGHKPGDRPRDRLRDRSQHRPPEEDDA